MHVLWAFQSALVSNKCTVNLVLKESMDERMGLADDNQNKSCFCVNSGQGIDFTKCSALILK